MTCGKWLTWLSLKIHKMWIPTPLGFTCLGCKSWGCQAISKKYRILLALHICRFVALNHLRSCLWRLSGKGQASSVHIIWKGQAFLKKKRNTVKMANYSFKSRTHLSSIHWLHALFRSLSTSQTVCLRQQCVPPPVKISLRVSFS